MTDRRSRVLIVEKDLRILKMLKIRFDRNGYDVITAKDGGEAMSLIESQAPGVMLLDLPVAGGFEVLQKLGPSSRLPTIALSVNRDLGEEALKLGARAFFAKPFDLDKLAAKVSDLSNSPR